jgi:hypothetical protein
MLCQADGMPTSFENRNASRNREALRHQIAWWMLVGALAVHVVDEALTDFLGFYNPLVLDLRSKWSWFPMPTFTFGVWLVGLIVLVAVLAGLGPAVRRNAPGMWIASGVLAAIMLLNGLGHLLGSVIFHRWLPGATSAPLLIITSIYLMKCTSTRMRHNFAAADPNGY